MFVPPLIVSIKRTLWSHLGEKETSLAGDFRRTATRASHRAVNRSAPEVLLQHRVGPALTGCVTWRSCTPGNPAGRSRIQKDSLFLFWETSFDWNGGEESIPHLGTQKLTSERLPMDRKQALRPALQLDSVLQADCHLVRFTALQQSFGNGKSNEKM